MDKRNPIHFYLTPLRDFFIHTKLGSTLKTSNTIGFMLGCNSRKHVALLHVWLRPLQIKRSNWQNFDVLRKLKETWSSMADFNMEKKNSVDSTSGIIKSATCPGPTWTFLIKDSTFYFQCHMGPTHTQFNPTKFHSQDSNSRYIIKNFHLNLIFKSSHKRFIVILIFTTLFSHPLRKSLTTTSVFQVQVSFELTCTFNCSTRSLAQTHQSQ